jgi:hypothetical protein
LGLFKFISDYLPYFEKKIYIFYKIIAKKLELIYKDWSKLFVRFIRNNLKLVTRWVQPDWGYFFMNWTKIAINPSLNIKLYVTLKLIYSCIIVALCAVLFLTLWPFRQSYVILKPLWRFILHIGYFSDTVPSAVLHVQYVCLTLNCAI